MGRQPSEFTVTPEDALAWITHLSREAPYFALIPTDEWITPAQVRALHSECARVAALGDAAVEPETAEEVGGEW